MTEINCDNFLSKISEFNESCEDLSKKQQENKQRIDHIENVINMAKEDLNAININPNMIDKEIENTIENIGKTIYNIKNKKNILENQKKLIIFNYRIELLSERLKQSNNQNPENEKLNLSNKIKYFKQLLNDLKNEEKNLKKNVDKIKKDAEKLDKYFNNNLSSKKDVENIIKNKKINKENIDEISEYFYLNTASGTANIDFPKQLLKTASTTFGNLTAQQNTEEIENQKNFVKKCILSAILIYHQNMIIQDKKINKLNEIKKLLNDNRFNIRIKNNDKTNKREYILYELNQGENNLNNENKDIIENKIISNNLDEDLKNELKNLKTTLENLNKYLDKKYIINELKF